MNKDEILSKRKQLIFPENKDWNEILHIRTLVNSDFNKKAHLSLNSFKRILNWKLPDQKNKIEKILSFCPESLLKQITNCYVSIEHPDKEMELRIKLHILIGIPWIGIGISSAIMAFHKPDVYGSMDLLSWSRLFGKEKRTLTKRDYLVYLPALQKAAIEIGCDPQELEFLICQD